MISNNLKAFLRPAKRRLIIVYSWISVFLGFLLFRKKEEVYYKLLKSSPTPFFTETVLRYRGAKIGERVYFLSNIIIRSKTNYQNLEIGDNCFVGQDVSFDLADKIILERDAAVSDGVKIYTHTDPGDRVMKNYPGLKKTFRSVCIGYGSSVRPGAIIMPGIKVGRCSIIAAGAVVIEDVADFTMVGGVPAKEIKKIDPSIFKE